MKIDGTKFLTWLAIGSNVVATLFAAIRIKLNVGLLLLIIILIAPAAICFNWWLVKEIYRRSKGPWRYMVTYDADRELYYCYLIIIDGWLRWKVRTSTSRYVLDRYISDRGRVTVDFIYQVEVEDF